MTVRFHYSPVCCVLKIGGTFLGKVPFTSRFPEPATGIYCVPGMSRGFYLIPHNSLLGLPVGRLGLSDAMQFAQ